MRLPTYDPAKDGNVFAWIMAQARALRERGGNDAQKIAEIRAQRQAKAAIQRAMLSAR